MRQEHKNLNHIPSLMLQLMCSFSIRFELKKISEMSEEDLKEFNNHTETEVTEASESQQEENTDQPDEKIPHAGTARTITASKILKANLAC